MNILDIAEFYSQRGGGIRSHLTNRGHVLRHLGHDHVVIAPGPKSETIDLHATNAPTQSGTGDGRGRARVMRVAGAALPYDPTYHLLWRFDRIRAIVRAEHPDVLEAHSPYLAALAVVACRRLARVRTAFWHSDHFGTFVLPALARRLGEGAAGWMQRQGWRRALRGLLAPFDATFVAGAIQERALREAGVQNVVLVPFGVDKGVFSPAAGSATRRRELGEWAPGALLVGVGRLSVEKRWDVVLEAFGRVRARRPASLIVFGDGPERARLERAAPPGVTFAGFESDRAMLASSLASADVLVHGCPHETFGLAVAEAAACGLPVVVPDEGGAAACAEPSCAETYASLDARACAAAIERALDRPRGELRARALAAVAGVASTEEHFARVLLVYDNLLRRPRAW